MKIDSTINIRKIAEMADCSPSTVSRVLAGRVGSIKISESTRAKIRKVCEELDYQPSIHASRLFSKHSKVIGFLTACNFLPEDDNLAKSFFHLCEELSQRGYRLLPLLNNVEFQTGKEYLNIFKRNEIDGLVIWGAQEKHTFFLEELRKAEYPFILITNKVGDYPTVYSNQRQPVFELTRTCIRKGAGRIAGIMATDGFSYLQRKQGFDEAVLNSSCESRLWISEPPADRLLQISYSHAPEILAWKPDAVICANDEMAVGIGKYCFEHNIRIPEQVMLTGGDNVKLSEYSQIALTTFDQMAALCAETAAKLMVNHLQNHQPLETREIPAQIVWRNSLAV